MIHSFFWYPNRVLREGRGAISENCQKADRYDFTELFVHNEIILNKLSPKQTGKCYII